MGSWGCVCTRTVIMGKTGSHVVELILSIPLSMRESSSCVCVCLCVHAHYPAIQYSMSWGYEGII